MPRYEFTKGSSNKFWEITRSGKSFTTSYGKVGSAGQSTTKSFDSAADAKKEYDKLVEAKTKKGYVPTKAKKAKPAAKKAKPKKTEPAAKPSSNSKLEATIAKDPDNTDVFAVLGDWLQEQGDPRGELISLMLHGKERRAKNMIQKNAQYFLGSLAEHQRVHDDGGNNGRSYLRNRAQEKAWQKTQHEAFLWRLGYIDRVRLSHNEYSDEKYQGRTVDLLAATLAHPSGRFIREFSFQSNGDPNEDDLQDLIDLLGKKAPSTTRKITFGDNVDQISWHRTGNLQKLWKGVPKLRVLELETGEFETGKIVAPALERAVFVTGGLSKSCARSIAKGTMPKLRHLEIYYGDPHYGGNCTAKEVKPLLDRTDLKKLEYLGLKNAKFTNDIAKLLRGAKVLKKLKTLDLSCGTLTDEGAEALVGAKASLKHLDCLDLSQSYLSGVGIKAVKGLCQKVITKDQRQADNWHDKLHYYVSVSE